jgi:KDO2-lipid IV(A) lauroyltransferase
MPPTAPPPNPIAGTMLDRATDLALRGLLAAAHRIPYERRVPFFGAAVRVAGGPLAGWRRRALANLAMIHPHWPEARRRAVADSVLDNIGRTLIESYSAEELATRIAGEPIRGEGLAAFEEARAAGRPVLLISGHFGNFQVPRHALAARGHVAAGLYRDMANPYVNAHYVRTIEAIPGPAFAQGKGTLGFVRHLARGGVAAMLFDLHVMEGVPIPFLGRPAMTATTPADLALRTGALLLPCFGIRRADGLSFDIVLEPPIPHGNPLAMMAEATRRLEARIAAHPGQWFWIHRRWKGAPCGAVSPPSAPLP